MNSWVKPLMMGCYQLILKPMAFEGQFRRVGITYAEIGEFNADGNLGQREVIII
jgi:hypothetical protein